jgi:hypothetical protein
MSGVQGWPGLHSKTVSQKQQTNNDNTAIVVISNSNMKKYHKK